MGHPEISASRHLALLRRAGDVMTIAATLAAALFIALMTGLVSADPERSGADATGTMPAASTLVRAPPEAPLRTAQAVSVVRAKTLPAAATARCGPADRRCRG